MSAIRKINRDLKREFGVAPTDALGRAHFRLAMTAGQVEVRKGTVVEDTNGDGTGIYIRTVEGVHRLPKYNWGDYATKPHYVLERLMFTPLPMDEVPEAMSGTYEPVHVFPFVEEKCMMPPYRGIQLVIYCLLYGPKKVISDWEAEDKQKMEQEVALFQDMLDDQSPWLAGQIGRGEAAATGVGESPLIKALKEKQ